MSAQELNQCRKLCEIYLELMMATAATKAMVNVGNDCVNVEQMTCLLKLVSDKLDFLMDELDCWITYSEGGNV